MDRLGIINRLEFLINFPKIIFEGMGATIALLGTFQGEIYGKFHMILCSDRLQIEKVVPITWGSTFSRQSRSKKALVSTICSFRVRIGELIYIETAMVRVTSPRNLGESSRCCNCHKCRKFNFLSNAPNIIQIHGEMTEIFALKVIG